MIQLRAPFGESVMTPWLYRLAPLVMAVPLMVTPAWAQVVSALLNPVMSAWIEGEVDSVENLQVQIGGSDPEIVSGTIPSARVAGQNLVYQGFYLSQVVLDGQNIRLNINDVLQGQQLRLLQPVPVAVQLQISESDLNQSLQSPLIREQLAQAQVELPIGNQTVPFVIQEPRVTLFADQLQIDAQLQTPDGSLVPVTLTTGLEVVNGNQLILRTPAWQLSGQTLPVAGLDGFAIDLGSNVQVQSLELLPGELRYQGQLTIMPELV